MKWFYVSRWLLVAGSYCLSHPEWEASLPCCSSGAKLLRGLRWHLPLSGDVIVFCAQEEEMIVIKGEFINVPLSDLFLSFSSGVMETGLMSSLTTASRPSTTSWSSLSPLRGMSSGALCWRKLTPSECADCCYGEITKCCTDPVKSTLNHCIMTIIASFS